MTHDHFEILSVKILNFIAFSLIEKWIKKLNLVGMYRIVILNLIQA